MFNKFIDASSELYESNEAFAIAHVVKKKGLTSGKPGDKAVIKKRRYTHWMDRRWLL